MTTTIIFADPADQGIYCTSTVYATARSGAGTITLDSASETNIYSGQTFISPTYYVEYALLPFDTSSIPDADAISTAILSMSLNVDLSTTDFTNNARLYDFGATIETTDFVAGASLSALPLVAHLDSSGMPGNLPNFVNDALPANINKTGFTRLILCSSRTEAGTTPTGDEDIQWRTADSAGTTDDPKITITHAAAEAPAEAPRVSYLDFPKFLLRDA